MSSTARTKIRLSYIILVGIAVAALLGFSVDREDMILTEFRIFVPLTLMTGIIGLIRTLTGHFNGVQDLREGVLWLCINLQGWSLDAGRAWVRRTLVSEGFSAWGLEENNFRVFTAALLVVAGIMSWRWAMRWPRLCFDPTYPTAWNNFPLCNELPWATLLLAWVVFAVFGEQYFIWVTVKLYMWW